jgi:lipopolysaccharide export system permease protein
MFIKRAELLIPLAVLIASIKQLLCMLGSGELVALQASGISLKKIARPFLLLCGLCTLFSYSSFEYFLPSSLNFLDRFRETHFKHAHRGSRTEPVHALYLKDGSRIIYQAEDREKNQFFDVFWIRSSDDIWRMQTLSCDPNRPLGTFVDHIQRDQRGNLIKTESFETHTFPLFKRQPDLAGKGYVPIENRKISELTHLLTGSKRATAVERPQILSHLLFKLVMPLFPFLSVIAIFPYCVRYSRMIPAFLIYALAIFCFIAFSTLIDAGVILGENNIISPFAAILGPFLICSMGFGWKFAKT